MTSCSIHVQSHLVLGEFMHLLSRYVAMSILTLFPTLAFGQIVADYTPTSTTTAANVSSLVVPSTVTAGNNRFLVIMIAQEDTGSSSDLDFVSVVRQGLVNGTQNFTRLTTARESAYNQSRNEFAVSNIWYLLNPHVGNDSITITTSGVNNRITANAFSFKNVEQSTSGIVGAKGVGTRGSVSTNISPSSSQPNSWVLSVAVNTRETIGFTASGAGHSEFAGLESSLTMRADFAKIENVSSTTNLGWDASSGNNNYMAMSAISFAPAPVPEPATVGLVGVAGLVAFRFVRKKFAKKQVS
jgi:hypothetical protein